VVGEVGSVVELVVVLDSLAHRLEAAVEVASVEVVVVAGVLQVS
jgi:hypothetical protein